MIGAELDFQSVRRAGLRFIDQDRFAMHFPRKVIETRYLAPETRRLNVAATSRPHRTPFALHERDIVVGITVGNEDGIDARLSPHQLNTRDVCIKVGRGEIADEEIDMSQSPRLEIHLRHVAC